MYSPCYLRVRSFASLFPSFIVCAFLLNVWSSSVAAWEGKDSGLQRWDKAQRIKSIDKVQIVFHAQKEIAVLVALLCRLISASQLTYLLINLFSTFYYRGRQILAQILASLSQRRRIRARQRRPNRARKASAWVKWRMCLGWSSRHLRLS